MSVFDHLTAGEVHALFPLTIKMSPRKTGKKQPFPGALITWTRAVGVQVAAPASQGSAPFSAGRAVADKQISWAFLLAPDDEEML